MKLSWSTEATTRTVSHIIVVLVGIAFCFLLLNIKGLQSGLDFFLSLIKPFIYGFVIAYLLAEPIKFMENTLLKGLDKGKKRAKLKRSVAVFVALILSFLIIGALLSVVLPQLIDSMLTLVNNIQLYIANAEVWAKDMISTTNIDPVLYEQVFVTWEQILDKSSAILVTLFQQLIGFTGHVTAGVLNIFVAIIISIYLLTAKERYFAQIKKVLYALLPSTVVERIVEVGRLSNKTFNGFINGKIIDSLIIGVITFVCLSLMKMPYILLVSVIIGVTNIIPFFGPFIGAIPSVFIIFIVDPVKALWFIIFIFLLQQFDGNILGPKILGNSTGLPAVWVLFAILVGGGVAGFVGMLVGVPTFAVIYALFKGYLEQRLMRKGMSKETENYASEDNPIEF